MHDHQPVLLQEAIEYLAIDPNGIYIDATFGRGGHSQAILEQLNPNGFLLAIDKDPEAVAYAQQQFKKKLNFNIQQGSFNMLQTFVNRLGLSHKINGILLDLGVSSPQVDNAKRGFSFLHDGPLDMRMNPQQELDAAHFINTASETEIAQIIYRYGEERYAKRIARAIVTHRLEPIMTTKRLATIIADAHPAWEKHKHPATRSFQAIRIHINQELQDLQQCLEQSLSVLAAGGRLVVISFHSLEDRIVKNFIQCQQRGGEFLRKLPLTQAQFKPKLKRIAWGIKANEQEVARNPRSRSATLRVAEKL